MARPVEVPEEVLELEELELECELDPELLELERLLEPDEPLPERELLDEELDNPMHAYKSLQFKINEKNNNSYRLLLEPLLDERLRFFFLILCSSLLFSLSD